MYKYLARCLKRRKYSFWASDWALLTLPWHSPGPELSSDFIKPSYHLRTTLHHSRTPFCPIFVHPLRGLWRKEARLGCTSPLEEGRNRRGERSSTRPASLNWEGRGGPGIQSAVQHLWSWTQTNKTTWEWEGGGRASGRASEESLSQEVTLKLRS